MVKKEYKQTELGAIPVDWQILTFEDVLTGFSSGMTPYRGNPEYYKGNIPWVTSGELNYNLITNTYEKITKSAVINTNLKLLPKGTFLMAITGLEAAGTRGSCALLGIDATTNQSCLSLFSTEKLTTKYLYYFYLKYGEEYAFKYAQGTKQQSFTGKIIKKFPIIVPPTVEEQNAIAEVLTNKDKLIQNLKTLISKKKAIKQGTMQELLAGKRRLKGFTGNWETKKLADISFIKTGSKNNQDKINDGLYPFFVRSQTIEKINSYSYDCEAILVPGEGGIGSIFHYINGKFDVHQRVYVISDFSEKVFSMYVYLYMKEHFGVHAMKNSVKATVDSLRLPTFQVFELKIPKDLEEQKAIAQILSDMDGEIEGLEIQLQKTQNLKHGMMKELLTGKIRLVQPANNRKREPKITRINQEWIEKEASVLAMIVSGMEIPIGHFRYQKYMYLFHRYVDGKAEGFKKFAAGPYSYELRYNGPEDFIEERKWCNVRKLKSGNPRFTKGIFFNEAKEEFLNHYTLSNLKWLLDNFKFFSDDELELYTTLDMAIEDLKKENKLVNILTVKQTIKEEKEWKHKLKRPIFSNENIKTVISKIKQLFN